MYRINAEGGKSIATYESLEDAQKIVETARKLLGGVDVIICNASFQQPIGLKSTSEEDIWKSILTVDVKGAYKV